MKLWVISQNQHGGYDTYDVAVVAAETEDDARSTHPGGHDWDPETLDSVVWCDGPHLVDATYLGEAAPNVEAGVIVASFNAG